MPPTPSSVRPVPAGTAEDLGLLLGPDAGDLLGAVAEAAGAHLGTWRATSVDHRPGRSTVVQYRVDLRTPGGDAVQETFVAATGERIPVAGAARFADGTTDVAVWRWSADPWLPGLRAAVDADAVARLLADVGLGDRPGERAWGGGVRLRVRAYRPGRRAVVEATGRSGRLFLKVVPPDAAAALHERHRLLHGVLPVPDSLGWTDDGVVVLATAPGATLRAALRDGDPTPAPEELLGLLDRLPASLADGPARRDVRSAAVAHGRVIAATVPEVRGLLDDVLAGVTDGPDTDHPLVPVHGDLHDAQVMVERGRVTGLLDVDTAGCGRRVDDLATCCAHLSVMGAVSDRPRHTKRYGSALLALAEQQHDPQDLRRRIAAAVVGLATGPFRVQEPAVVARTQRRLELAAAWLPRG